jgi:hypothetical protein
MFDYVGLALNLHIFKKKKKRVSLERGVKGRLKRDGADGADGANVAITPSATIRFHSFSNMLSATPYTKN